jgi:hypothetical protein
MSEMAPPAWAQATEAWQWRRERAIADFREAGGMFAGNATVLGAVLYGLGYRGAALRREVAYIRDYPDAR